MDLAQSSSVEMFFRDELDRALKEHGLDSGTLTEHYLVQLLAAYVAQPISDEPLALKMMSALEATPRERRMHLREVGDTSLYVSGFWQDSLERRTVDVDYYIGIGGSAYRELSRGGPGWTRDPLGDVFGDLAEHFVRFVEVLMVVARRTTRLSPTQDVVRLYDRFRRTRSRWAARRLASLGVVPGSDDGEPQ